MCNGNECNCKECLNLGDTAPDFVATTTQGEIKFSEYIKGSWVILFSHPADFTPVCTTEFLAFAEKQEEFDKRGVKLIGLSIDSVYSHIAWLRAIEEKFEVKIKFPVIADLTMDVARKYGMIHSKVSNTHAVRTITIINPSSEVAFLVTYPMSVGRNIEEIIRIIDAMQVVEEKKVATPANWQVGDNAIIPPPQTMDDAQKRLEKHKNDSNCYDWFLCKTKIR
jgi:peroxiredoxin (alkyl hydroperoxide reductase subunit C)